MSSDKKSDKEKKPLVPDWPRAEMEEVDDKQEAVIQELMDRLIRKTRSSAPTPTTSEEKKAETADEKKDSEYSDEPLWPVGPPPEDVANMTPEDQRIHICKFCVARKFNIDDAEKMARSTWLFKSKYNFHQKKSYFPCAFPMRGWDDGELNKVLGLEPRIAPEAQIEGAFRTIIQTHQVVYHKWDNQGHPVLIERTGNIQPKGLVNGLKGIAKIGQPIHEPIVDYHVYFNEVGIRLMDYQDQTMGKKLGRRVLGFTAIMDCDGLGFGHMHSPALDIMKKVWACDAAHYPEGLHKCFIVNCPGSIEFLFRVVRGWLDARIQEKIVFVTADKTPQTLLEVVDAENLPEFLGGTCTCDGGCVVKGLSAAEEAAADGAEVKTEEITIKAGSKETREFVLAEGEEITWEFEVVDKNIEFYVDFVPDANPNAATSAASPATPTPGGKSPAASDDGSSSKPIVVAAKGKSRGQASNYVAEQAGKLVMVWDNSYSWLKGKTLRMRLLKV